MMSISRIVFALIGLVAALAPNAVATDPLGLLMVFNNNQLSSTKYCDAAEWAAIQDVLTNVTAHVSTTSPLPPVRARRLLNNSRGKGATHGRHRELRRCWCSPYCGYSGTGKCPLGMSSRRHRRDTEVVADMGESAKYSKGHGGSGSIHRRRTASDSARSVVAPLQDQHRQVQTAPTTTVPSYAPCDAAQVQRMHNALIALKPTVSPPCRLLVDARSLTCAAGTSNCGIYTVHLINATSDTVLQANIPFHGLTFCKSAYVSFQADTEFDLGSVNFWLSGPNGYDANRTEYKDPYYMYGNKMMETYNNIDGKTYPRGDFSLTVTSEYMPNEAVTISFTTLDC